MKITSTLEINDEEIQITFIRAPGPGGQNVNKVATAVLLRFNLLTATIPLFFKEQLLLKLKHKLTTQGDILIKASRFRSQERNKIDALNRLVDILRTGAMPIKKRKKTKPSFSSKQKRLATKKFQGKTKILRRKPIQD